MSKIIVLVVLLVVSCAPKESFQQTFPIPIKEYFYSKVGNQLIFTIEFENEIPASLTFEMLNFQSQKLADYVITSKKVQFKSESKSIVLEANLTSSEAILVYKMDNKVQQYKFRNVVEKSNQ